VKFILQFRTFITYFLISYQANEVVRGVSAIEPITSVYKLKNIKISRVNEINDIGVTFDSKLNFKLHTNNINLRNVHRSATALTGGLL